MRRNDEYMPDPVVPYMMNRQYGYYGRGSVVNHVANPLSAGYGYLNRESRQDAARTLQMYGNRTKYYNEFLRRWETQLTDMRTVTVERKDGRLYKYVHTPVIMTERYYTEMEHRFKIAKILSLSVLLIALVISVCIAIGLGGAA